jgi:hypothetical protein
VAREVAPMLGDDGKVVGLDINPACWLPPGRFLR